MKKVLFLTVALTLALTAKVFAEETKATDAAKAPTATTAPVKTEAPKVVATAPTTKPTPAATETTLKGNITGMDATTLKVKDNANKEWAFKVGTVNCKEYKIGDSVEVKYEKENLKSIAKATK
ncbi:MAG: hypothetical protein HYY43_02620 [Deltaproteobacteria bacterium]|nr:hypothetical protein [Deltaproteobacteria bacterium]